MERQGTERWALAGNSATQAKNQQIRVLAVHIIQTCFPVILEAVSALTAPTQIGHLLE
jgi:hypothetical protein